VARPAGHVQFSMWRDGKVVFVIELKLEVDASALVQGLAEAEAAAKTNHVRSKKHTVSRYETWLIASLRTTPRHLLLIGFNVDFCGDA
jgi:hypothetical protein